MVLTSKSETFTDKYFPEMVLTFMLEAVNSVNIFITYNGSNVGVGIVYLFQSTYKVQLMVLTLKSEMFTNKYFPETVLIFISEADNPVNIFIKHNGSDFDVSHLSVSNHK